jgi:hypothetical protein
MGRGQAPTFDTYMRQALDDLLNFETFYGENMITPEDGYERQITVSRFFRVVLGCIILLGALFSCLVALLMFYMKSKAPHPFGELVLACALGAASAGLGFIGARHLFMRASTEYLLSPGMTLIFGVFFLLPGGSLLALGQYMGDLSGALGGLFVVALGFKTYRSGKRHATELAR